MTAAADYERPAPPLLQCGIALSVAVGGFAVVGWLLKGGLLPWPGWADLTAQSAIPAFYSVLAVIAQGTTAVASMAARRADSFGLEGSGRWARGVIGAGGLWNAYSLHNAFDQATGADASLWDAAVVWVVSLAIAFMEIAVYFIDESLKAKIAEARAAADAESIEDARQRDRGELRRIDPVAMTDSALKAGIAEATSVKRTLELERKRRIGKNIVTN
mgnify:CR=1 FL=1